jgi:prepilin-type N-terminal cleavage/methylation domain-containing protein
MNGTHDGRGRDGARSRKTRRGLSLLEIMIALAILAVALSGIISATLHGQTMQDLNRQLDLARAACVSKMEELRARNWDTIVTLYGGLPNANNRFGVPGLRPPPAVAANQMGVVTLDVTNANLLEVRVRVDWQSQKGVRKYETSMLVTR